MEMKVNFFSLNFFLSIFSSKFFDFFDEFQNSKKLRDFSLMFREKMFSFKEIKTKSQLRIVKQFILSLWFLKWTRNDDENLEKLEIAMTFLKGTENLESISNK